jgi:hypothetical protein
MNLVYHTLMICKAIGSHFDDVALSQRALACRSNSDLWRDRMGAQTSARMPSRKRSWPSTSVASLLVFEKNVKRAYPLNQVLERLVL